LSVHVAGAGYFVAPFFGWFVAGSVKFAINSLRARRMAWHQVGYGGMPSTHTAIVSTTAVLIGLREGWDSAVFAVATALALIVMLDAMSLRAKIGEHARLLNRLHADASDRAPLRERIGHHWTEVVAGAVLGGACALALYTMG
jgi:acid phosphatase family membrane protein YuiD